MVQPESSHLQGNQPDRDEVTVPRVHFDEVHHSQVASEFLVSSDSLIVVQKVPASVENQPLIPLLMLGSSSTNRAACSPATPRPSRASPQLGCELSDALRELSKERGVANFRCASLVPLPGLEPGRTV